ncbi:MAG: YitT family protein [Tenericutes bacterium]|nr:YitT family protein [Mycoplasmatota bacterium]
MKRKIKEWVLINIGVLMVSGGLYFFLMPSNLAVGGANGLAIVINNFVPTLAVGIIMIAINLILFIIAFLLVGKAFGAKTIYSSLAVSIIIFILEKAVPITNPISGDLLLELIFGILLAGAGMGIVFNQNASTGGTDIIAKILNKFFYIDLGKGVFLADILITVLAGFAFGIEKSLYAMLGVIFNSYVIDHIIEGFNVKKEVTIISEDFEIIKNFIISDLDRGFTVFYGKGGYSNEDRSIITVVLGKRQFIRLRTFINQLESTAFLTVNSTHEVYGDGFRNL